MQQSATDSSGTILNSRQVKYLQSLQLLQCFSSQVLFNLQSCFQSGEAWLAPKEAAQVYLFALSPFIHHISRWRVEGLSADLLIPHSELGSFIEALY